MAFENAAVQAAKDWDRPGPLVEALQVRARINLEMGDARAARADILTARASVLKVAEPQRARSESEFGPIEAQLIEGPASLSLLDKSVAFWEGKSPAKLPVLLLQRGRALQASGNVRRAAEDYKAGIAIIERQRQDVQLEYQRISFLDQSWSLYTALATLELQSGRPDLALAAWDRGKARGLLDALAPSNRYRREPRVVTRTLACTWDVSSLLRGLGQRTANLRGFRTGHSHEGVADYGQPGPSPGE